MKNIYLTTALHSQSFKEVEAISILGKIFILFGKRGIVLKHIIDSSFALQIISEIPDETLHGDRIYMLSGMYNIQLSIDNYGNKGYRIKIHCNSEHIYTSKKVDL